VCDLVALNKLIHNHFDIPSANFVEFYTDSHTRGPKHKIRKQHSSVNAFKFSFPQRCVDVWNSLPTAIVEVVSLSDFKRELNNVDLSCFCSFFL
jgi:hypothetical protein